MSDEAIEVHEAKLVPVADLKPHPENYRNHLPDQRAHISQSFRDVGVYKNVVLARDMTILAGHGVWETAVADDVADLPAVVLDLDPNEPRALKILAGDNEISRLAEVNDRGLSEILRRINDAPDAGLLGTGFDELMLSTLVMVTRPASEIRGAGEAAAWVGLPAFDTDADEITLVLHFDNETQRDLLVEQLALTISKKTRQTWSAWWPPRGKQDLASLRFEPEAEPAAADA